MDEEVIDYNLKGKVIFTVSDFTKRFNDDELEDAKLFSIGTTKWSINLSKEEDDNDEEDEAEQVLESDYYLNLYIELKKSLQNSVKIYLNIHVKDNLNKKRYNNNVGFVEYTKENNGWGFKLGNQILEDPNQFLVNDCLIVYVDIKVLDEFKLYNNQNYNFESVFNNQQLNDFKLIVKGKEFFVSKAILSSRSPVFQSMFCNDMKEKNESQCVIDDIDVDVFEEFLNFIYSGKLSKIETMADKLLDISDRFQVKELVTICEQLLIFDLNINNALNSLIIADKHNCIELKTKALKYVLKNISKFKTNNLETFVGNYKQLTIEMLKLGELLSKTQSEDTLEVFSYSLS